MIFFENCANISYKKQGNRIKIQPDSYRRGLPDGNNGAIAIMFTL